MSNKIQMKRLFIYLALSFGLTWAIFFAFIITGHNWTDSDQNLISFMSLGMLCPAIAHVITRWITNEGFAMTGKDSMMLGISFKDKKWVYFIFAMLVPWIYTEAGNALVVLFNRNIFDPEYYKIFGINKKQIFIMPIASIVNGVMFSFAAFGEEAGWRGYMMPKLLNMMSTWKAVIVGGIIWGLWHAPLTCIGHNFGMDYPGFPYLGVIEMCLICIFDGIILTYVTVKSGSIWPAAILHAVNNANPSVLVLFMNPANATGIMSYTVVHYLIFGIPMMLIALICFRKLCKKEKTL